MGVIKTSLGLTKTLKNVGRLKEIISVFARNGFEEFIGAGMLSYVPDFVLPKSAQSVIPEDGKEEVKNWYQILGMRLRLSFEELGPAFVKFGQLLSTREDMFHPDLITELKLLRDKVKGIPFKEAIAEIENAYGRPHHEIFKEIDEHPIGTASIGVVYRATLFDDQKVVIKIRRPGIEKQIDADLDLFLMLALQLEKRFEELRYLGLSKLVRDFAYQLEGELNLNIEATNCEKLKKNIAAHDLGEVITLPGVHRSLCRENIIVLDFLDGVPFSNAKLVLEKKDELFPKLEKAIRLFIKTFLQDGFFHADLHGGNFFLMPDGKIGLVDFGLMGHLAKKDRLSFIAILYSLNSLNFEQLVSEFLNVAEYDDVPDIDQLVRDVRNLVTPFMSLTVQQANFSLVVPAIMRALSTHHIYLPREWFVVFRALMTLDGVGKSLGYDFDLFEVLSKDLEELIKTSYTKGDLLEDGLWFGRSLFASVKTMPRHLHLFWREMAKRNYAFEVKHTGHEESVKAVAKSVNFLSYSILIGVFVISGVLFTHAQNITSFTEVPLMSLISWGIAVLLLVRIFVFK